VPLEKNNLKRSISFISIFLFIFLIAIVFYKSLKTEKTFVPNELIGKKITNFSSKSLFDNTVINTEKIFLKNKFYIINIWSSWCGPCRQEHPYLLKLSNNDKLIIIGINFRDKKENALFFLKEQGNPYSEVLIDEKGSLSINLGAYGVPETFLVNDENIVLLKFIGPLNSKKYKKIINTIKNEK